MAKYTKIISNYADIMTIQEFLERVQNSSILPDDGSGYLVKDDLQSSQDVFILLDSTKSGYKKRWDVVFEDATHVAWYNK